MCVVALTKMTLMRILGVYCLVVTGSSVVKMTVGSGVIINCLRMVDNTRKVVFSATGHLSRRD